MNKQMMRVLQSGLRISVLGLAILFGQSQSTYAQWATNGNNINNTNSGNVGIGITAPELPLDIRKNAFVFNSDARAVIGAYDQTSMAQGVGGGIQFGGKYNTSGDIAGFASISGIKENGTNGNFASALVFTTRTYPNAQSEKLRISSTGNVGIGTTTPNERLSVLIQDAVNNGITNVLSIGHTSTGTPAAGLGSSLMFDAKRSDGSIGHIGYVAGVWEDPTNGTEDGALLFAPVLNSTGFGTERMRITSTGNVGIGTTAPSTKLHVIGDVTVSGNIGAKYQDVVEWVPAAKALPPGTVVTLNPTQSNFVEPSTKAYDTRVAGVISEKPGIALGESGENKVLVATTGRIRIKVDAATAPIGIGDLLVTSEKEGIAMKSMPINVGGAEIHRPGTLIGKALEPLAKGQGEILVLLSLQ